MDKSKRDFHPGWAKRPNGCHHTPFTVKLWQRWLEELNRRPVERYSRGIEQMRALLAFREPKED